MSDRLMRGWATGLAALVVIAVTVALLGMWGPAQTPASAEAAAVRYQISATESGGWLVDGATGRVWYCQPGGCQELPVANLHPRPGR